MIDFLYLVTGNLNYKYALAFAATVTPNYYGWWAIFNYLNEEGWYDLLYDQLFFSATELTQSYAALQMARKTETPNLSWVSVMARYAQCKELLQVVILISSSVNQS